MTNCPDIQEDVSLWVDGELDPSQADKLEKHLGSCAGCAALYEDLKSIRVGVESLEPIEPPARVWTSLRSQLLANGLVHSKPKEPLWARILPKSFPVLKPAWSSAILALFLVVSSLVIYDLTNRSPVGPDPIAVTSHQEALTEELRKAEANYRTAIEALRASSQKKLEHLDPTLAQIFNDNLATMDYYLNECKRAVEASPQNPLAHRYLLAAYQKKVELMQTILTSNSLL